MISFDKEMLNMSHTKRGAKHPQSHSLIEKNSAIQ